jgi:hypothetical protein
MHSLIIFLSFTGMLASALLAASIAYRSKSRGMWFLSAAFSVQVLRRMTAMLLELEHGRLVLVLDRVYLHGIVSVLTLWAMWYLTVEFTRRRRDERQC